MCLLAERHVRLRCVAALQRCSLAFVGVESSGCGDGWRNLIISSITSDTLVNRKRLRGTAGENPAWCKISGGIERHITDEVKSSFPWTDFGMMKVGRQVSSQLGCDISPPRSGNYLAVLRDFPTFDWICPQYIYRMSLFTCGGMSHLRTSLSRAEGKVACRFFAVAADARLLHWVSAPESFFSVILKELDQGPWLDPEHGLASVCSFTCSGVSDVSGAQRHVQNILLSVSGAG